MGDSDHLRYFVITAAVFFSVGNCNTQNRLRFERHPEGVDYDEAYGIKVIRGQEVISSTLSHGGHYREINVTVSAFNAVFVLNLHLNTHLFAAGYVERTIGRDGIVYHDVNHTADHCYYLGKVKAQPLSTAAVSTCKGIVGYFTVGNISYHIDPASSQLQGPHKVYRSRGDAKTTYKCGHDSSLANHAKHIRRLKRFIWPQDLDRTNKIVEVYVVNDYSQYLAQGSDVNAVIQRTKDIVNIANAGYQSLGIYLVLVGVEVWTTGDNITVNTSDKDSTLKQFAAYRMANINPLHYNDIGILITNNTFGNVSGYAFQGQMCKNRDSVAFVGDVYLSPSVAASIMDHEIGHSLDLVHDTDVTPCACSQPNNNCVMYPSVNAANPSFTWSQCSKDQLAYSFEHGLDSCLHNVPETIVPNNAFCGNGFVETGEQCDCGNSTDKECNKACCNPITCQLVAPATCAFGRCCNIDTCQILPRDTLCRGKADLCCDLDEFCDGRNYLCPNDTYLPDGTNCTVNNDSVYCYQGQCKSHNSQCGLIWGSATRASSSTCYTTFNDDGQEYGNCGMNWTPTITYIKCARSDALCGKLQCENIQRNVSYSKYYYRISTVSSGSTACLSIIFDFGLNTQDPGLVPNGASCGAGKMCVDQKCVDVSSVNTTPCASACQPNEVCNNLGQCQRFTGSCLQPTTTPMTTTPVQTTSAPAPTTSTQKPTITTPVQTISTPNPTTNRLPSTTVIPFSTDIAKTSTPSSVITTPVSITSISVATTSRSDSITSTPKPPTITPVPATSTPVPPKATTGQPTAKPDIVLILQVVLGIILGALVLALMTALMLFCCCKFCPVALAACFQLSAGAGQTTAVAPVEWIRTPVFTRGALMPIPSRLRWISLKQYYLPQREVGLTVTPQTERLQPDWNLLRRTRQPFGRGYQYGDGYQPCLQPFST